MSKSETSQRIAKLLARAGIASRREVERMIVEGRIALNGAVIDTPATLLENLHGVTVDGNPVAAPAPARLFRFHKPAGVLTAERDYSGRKTIYDILPDELPRVIPVGRLDLNTEGLLLLTTDGELKRQLELPATQVKRTYRARAFGEISQAQLEDLIEGIEIDGVRYGSIDANLERRTGANVWVEMTLTEGKNREVRRVLEHLGLRVSRLIRTSYGPIPLADMPIGAVDEVRQHDLIQFRRELKLPADKRSNTPLVTRARAPKPSAPAEEAPKGDRPGGARRGDAKPVANRDAPFRKRAASEQHDPRGGRNAGRPEEAPEGNRPLSTRRADARETTQPRQPRDGRASGKQRQPISGRDAKFHTRAAPSEATPANGPRKPVRRRAEPEALETDRRQLTPRPPRDGKSRDDRSGRPPRGPARPGVPRRPGNGPRKGPR